MHLAPPMNTGSEAFCDGERRKWARYLKDVVLLGQGVEAGVEPVQQVGYLPTAARPLVYRHSEFAGT
jgi:hypothetical protein